MTTSYSSKKPKKKVAVDIKSTYRQYTASGALKPFGFTLGSYRSYLRVPTKGILYPYGQYSEHWVIGFLYRRNGHRGLHWNGHTTRTYEHYYHVGSTESLRNSMTEALVLREGFASSPGLVKRLAESEMQTELFSAAR